MNILGKRYLFFGVSLLIILVGLGVMVLRGIPLSIDLTGGSLPLYDDIRAVSRWFMTS